MMMKVVCGWVGWWERDVVCRIITSLSSSYHHQLVRRRIQLSVYTKPAILPWSNDSTHRSPRSSFQHPSWSQMTPMSTNPSLDTRSYELVVCRVRADEKN